MLLFMIWEGAKNENFFVEPTNVESLYFDQSRVLKSMENARNNNTSSPL